VFSIYVKKLKLKSNQIEELQYKVSFFVTI